MKNKKQEEEQQNHGDEEEEGEEDAEKSTESKTCLATVVTSLPVRAEKEKERKEKKGQHRSAKKTRKKKKNTNKEGMKDNYNDPKNNTTNNPIRKMLTALIVPDQTVSTNNNTRRDYDDNLNYCRMTKNALSMKTRRDGVQNEGIHDDAVDDNNDLDTKTNENENTSDNSLKNSLASTDFGYDMRSICRRAWAAPDNDNNNDDGTRTKKAKVSSDTIERLKVRCVRLFFAFIKVLITICDPSIFPHSLVHNFNILNFNCSLYIAYVGIPVQTSFFTTKYQKFDPF